MDLRCGKTIALVRGRDEKRIVDSSGRADDTGPRGRFGRCWRVRGSGPTILWWLVSPVLGTLLGPSIRRLLLRASQRGSSQTGYQGEGRPGVHKWRLRGHDAPEQVDVSAPRQLQYRDSGSGPHAIRREGLRGSR